jgi:transcription initiation factor TFIID subunit 3
MLKPIPKIRTKEIRRELAEVPIIPPAPPSRYIDADGNEVWICPACGRQDDGSPMIGCDGCDAWYHWVCVGIQVPPDDSEDWYCRHCLSKKNEDLQSDKQKKKRKKREKKEH